MVATELEDSLIGDVSFDADGDVRPRSFVVVRLTPRANTGNGVLPGGANIAAVITP